MVILVLSDDGVTSEGDTHSDISDIVFEDYYPLGCDVM
jgi:hypothetical protein